MNFYELLFLISFFSVVIITLYNTFSLMSDQRGTRIRRNFLIFVLLMIMFGVGFMTWMVNPEIILFMQLFRLITFLFVLNVMFFIIETFLLLARKGNAATNGRYNPKEGMEEDRPRRLKYRSRTSF